MGQKPKALFPSMQEEDQPDHQKKEGCEESVYEILHHHQDPCEGREGQEGREGGHQGLHKVCDALHRLSQEDTRKEGFQEDQGEGKERCKGREEICCQEESCGKEETCGKETCGKEGCGKEGAVSVSRRSCM